ncbi:MAG: DUF2202 domain-containing protein [Candidatus Nanopelagicales bacterium]
MRRTLIVAGAAAGVLTLGVAAPAFAAGNGFGPGTGTASATCDGTGVPLADGTGTGGGPYGPAGSGRGAGRGQGGQGFGQGPGNGTGANAAAMGTLTATQKADLQFMVEEEKMAGDLYAAFAAKYDSAEFARIAASEDRHMASVQNLLDKYGIADPTDGAKAGVFDNADLQALYNKLLAQGMTSLDDAYDAGVLVEKTDIADLEKDLVGLTAPDVKRVYTNLLRGSTSHLASFEALA